MLDRLWALHVRFLLLLWRRRPPPLPRGRRGRAVVVAVRDVLHGPRRRSGVVLRRAGTVAGCSRRLPCGHRRGGLASRRSRTAAVRISWRGSGAQPIRRCGLVEPRRMLARTADRKLAAAGLQTGKVPLLG